MAKIGPITVQVNDPDGILDAIATLEHIRGDADHRIAALRAALSTPTTAAAPDLAELMNLARRVVRADEDGECRVCYADEDEEHQAGRACADLMEGFRAALRPAPDAV